MEAYKAHFKSCKILQLWDLNQNDIDHEKSLKLKQNEESSGATVFNLKSKFLRLGCLIDDEGPILEFDANEGLQITIAYSIYRNYFFFNFYWNWKEQQIIYFLFFIKQRQRQLNKCLGWSWRYRLHTSCFSWSHIYFIHKVKRCYVFFILRWAKKRVRWKRVCIFESRSWSHASSCYFRFERFRL